MSKDTLGKVGRNVAELRRRNRKARSEKFLSLVRAVADDEAPEAEEIDAVLRECNKSLDQLGSAVETQLLRRKLRLKVDEYSGAVADELPEIERRIEAAARELEAAKEKAHETTLPLYERRKEIDQMRHRAEGARKQLNQSVQDDSLLAEEKELKKELAEVKAGETQAGKEVASWQRKIEDNEAAIEDYELWDKKVYEKGIRQGRQPPRGYIGAASAEEELQFRMRPALKEARDRYDAARKRAAEIESRLAELQEQKLDP